MPAIVPPTVTKTKCPGRIAAFGLSATVAGAGRDPAAAEKPPRKF
jgi:hypothetical protein